MTITSRRLATAAVGLAAALATRAAAQGELLWVEPTRGVSIALDASDNVYTVDYEYNPGGDIYLTKRDASGTLLWTVRYDQTDTTRWEAAQWVATDSLGNAIVAGSSMSGYSNPVNAASILMKYSPSGQLLWRRVYENSFDGSYTRRCVVDEDDNIYVLGRAGGAGVTKVKKFSPEGASLWSFVDASGIGVPVNFKLTPDRHLVITGRSVYGSINGYAKIDLDGNPVWSLPGVFSLNVGDCDGDAIGNTYVVYGGTVVRKLGPSGGLLWERSYGGITGMRVEVGRDDRAVVSGFPASGGGAAFIKVDADGALVWSNLDADGPLSLLAHAHMLLDGDDNAYLAAGTMSEMAVCRVNADGSSGWTRTIPFGYANAIALASTDRSVYVVGGTTARLGQGDVPAPPAAPSNLVANAGGADRIDLGWIDNAGDEDGFAVQRCPGSASACAANPSQFVEIARTATDVDHYADSGLPPGTTHTYRVLAYNGSGNSAWSNTATATTLSAPPAAPTNLAARSGSTGNGRNKVPYVDLAWTDNASNETSYVVERCAGSSCTDFAVRATLGANATGFRDASVAKRTAYRYRVKARNGTGDSGYSNVASATTP